MPNQRAINHCIYAQLLVCYIIFVWSSQLILWSLLRPLHFIINDHNKCVTSSLGKWRSLRSDDHKFLTHQLPPCLNCCMLDEIRINPFDASYSVYYAFMTTWYLSSWVPCVRSGCVWCTDISRFSRSCFGQLFHIFPSCFLSSAFFPCLVFLLGFVSPLGFLSLSCVRW